MTWGEALRLTRILSADPSSQVGAATNDLDHPIEHADMTLRSLYDLTHTIAVRQGGKRSDPPPYPRPWQTGRQTKRRGDARLALGDLRRTLDAHRVAVDLERVEVSADG